VQGYGNSLVNKFQFLLSRVQCEREVAREEARA
jgi:hypothetical protein